MENKKSYFGEVASALKTLGIGLKVTLKEYFTPKTTEQYPENRKTTLHVAKRHRGRLVFKRNDDKTYKCTACTMVLDDYQYDVGDCMFCQLCVNSCNFDAIEFTNDFENSVFDKDTLRLHLDKEIYEGGSLPNLIEGGAPIEIGKFNTKTK